MIVMQAFSAADTLGSRNGGVRKTVCHVATMEMGCVTGAMTRLARAMTSPTVGWIRPNATGWEAG